MLLEKKKERIFSSIQKLSSICIILKEYQSHTDLYQNKINLIKRNIINVIATYKTRTQNIKKWQNDV